VPCSETETDYAADGTKSTVAWTFVIDRFGNVTEMYGDRGDDGTIDYDSIWGYDHLYGNLVQREEKVNGVSTYRSAYLYDNYGRLLHRESGHPETDQIDEWVYFGQQPVRTTQFLFDGMLIATIRCTYTMQRNGYPSSYSCVNSAGQPAARAVYTETADRRTIQISSDGTRFDREVDVKHAAWLTITEDYTLPPDMPPALQQRFVLGVYATGGPSAWDLVDETQPDMPHKTGTYEYMCQ